MDPDSCAPHLGDKSVWVVLVRHNIGGSSGIIAQTGTHPNTPCGMRSLESGSVSESDRTNQLMQAHGRFRRDSRRLPWMVEARWNCLPNSSRMCPRLIGEGQSTAPSMLSGGEAYRQGDEYLSPFGLDIELKYDRQKNAYSDWVDSQESVFELAMNIQRLGNLTHSTIPVGSLIVWFNKASTTNRCRGTYLQQIII